MGCSGSKAAETVVAPAQQAEPVSSEHNDGSTKPWKKNQVVPLPQEEDARKPSASQQVQKPPAAPAAAFAAESRKRDAAPVQDQGPSDVLAELKALCGEPFSGGQDLAGLAERLHKALNKHLPSALRTHSQLKHAQLLRDVAARASGCCDSILQPVLAHINRVLSNQEAGTSLAAESFSWEHMEFADFLGLLESACTAVHDQGIMDVGRALAGLMELLHTIQQHCESHKMALAPSTTRVRSLDELMSMLGILFFRKVVLETAESAGGKLEQYQQLQEQIGWTDAQLATCTGPQARATIMYLQQVTGAGEKRTNVTVQRCSAFWDSLACALADGLLPPPAGPMCHKYFPLFVDTYAQQAGTGKKPAVDAGEGHGPRKEFFTLAGQDMVGAGKAAAREDGSAAQQGEGSGARASSSGDHPALFVFNRSAGAYWYNTELVDSPQLRAAFTHAGWLLAQGLLNRAPLCLPLPPLLFRMLLEGDGFKPSLEALAEFDPDAAASVRNVAALPADQLGAMLELEGLPPGWTAAQYTDNAVRTLLHDGVRWQAGALSAGFFAALDRRLLRAWQLGPAALAALTQGSASGADGEEALSDVSKVFRVTLDEELSNHSALLVELLWEVLGGWPVEQRARFVEFVTGTARLPLPGSELLKIQAPFVAMGAAEHKAMLGMLPQAHTCDNLLELPNYWESLLHVRGVRGGPSAVTRGTAGLSAEALRELRDETRRIMDERLALAVNNFQGYGLDERSGGRDDDDDEYDQRGGGRVGRGLELDVPGSEPSTPAPLTFESLASLANLSEHDSLSGLPGLEAATVFAATGGRMASLPTRSPRQSTGAPLLPAPRRVSVGPAALPEAPAAGGEGSPAPAPAAPAAPAPAAAVQAAQRASGSGGSGKQGAATEQAAAAAAAGGGDGDGGDAQRQAAALARLNTGFSQGSRRGGAAAGAGAGGGGDEGEGVVQLMPPRQGSSSSGTQDAFA